MAAGHGGNGDRLVGPVVYVSASRAVDLGSIHSFGVDLFLGRVIPVHLGIGTLVATLPGAWGYMVSSGTGWPGVSILWLGAIESVICSFYLSVAARGIV